ncbi:hypothetical protein [Streptomyces sp. TLI_185]|uniref:hypothetical protein n=1 Tax=Streptomyces sp. TLI_185 TaxID=2485151 RepID=UPI000F4DBD60|nr:hypothetical protein [Streptomyces sp. TLI_185]RPF34594.1 putative lipoprotein with Yx(FWY)xxD motif [Streptomyces sp. TLI_185]
MWMATPKKSSPVIQHRIVLASAAGLVCAFLLAACDSSNSDVSGTSAAGVAPVASAPATSASATLAPAGGGDSGSGQTATVRAEAVKGGGSVVTDGTGATLYRYDKDRPNPSRWTCAGACVKTWIPVIVPDSVRTVGVEKSLLGTVHRDGRKQLTLGGWPLYRYVGDTGAGQLNGQGKDGEWYAVTPSGGKSVF